MKNKLFVLVILISVIPLIYLALVFNSLPPIVATHFGIDGKPNGYSTKNTLIFIVAGLFVLNLGMYLLLTNLSKIDPKRAVQQSKETMQKMGLSIVLLLNAITVIIIFSAVHNGFKLTKVMLPLMGLFFAYLGNLMYNVKPNYFVGIRTPWALEDPETWRKTHQLAGKLWFAGGLLICIVTLITPAEVALICMLATLAIITLVPAVYSYTYFHSHRK